MLAGVTRLQTQSIIIVMGCGGMVLMGSQSVMVLGMFVIGERVDMQRGDLAGGRGQHQTEQDRD